MKTQISLSEVSEKLDELKSIAEELRNQNLPVIKKIGKKKFAPSSYSAGYNAGLDFMTNQINKILNGQKLHHLELLDKKH